MINTHLNKQRGVVTLMVASILLFLVTVTSFYAASALIMEQRTVSNNLVAEQALQAAEAGLGHAQAYLISVGPSGVVDATTLTGELSNGSRFTVQLDFVNGSNDLIDVVSTGFAPSDQTSKTHRERAILIGGAGALGFDEPVKATGAVTMIGADIITNLVTDYTVHSGGAFAITGSAHTVLSSGVSSDKKATGADVIENDAVLAAVSDADLFQSHFGTSFSDAIAPGGSTVVYNGSGDYSAQLSGVTGEVIEINPGAGGASLSGSYTIGSAADPVTLVVNGGDLSINGSIVLYGNIVSTNNVSIAGSDVVHGSIKAGGDITVRGNVEVNGNVLAGNDLSMAGNGEINGVMYAANEANMDGYSQVNGSALVGGDFELVGYSMVTYTEGNISTYSSSGGTEYARLLGSWRNF